MRTPNRRPQSLVTVRAILFDFAGTLTRLPEQFDHGVPWANYLDALAEEAPGHYRLDRAEKVRALASAEAESWRDCVERGLAWTLDDILRRAGLPRSDRAARRYFDSFAAGTAVSPEAIQVLQVLADRGVATAVLSNTLWPRDWIEECLEAAAVLSLLKDVVVSSEHTYCKPHLEFFNEGRRRIGFPADQILMVGDRLYEDIYGGQRAGMHTALAPGVQPQAGPKAAEPDHRLSSLVDVLGLVG